TIVRPDAISVLLQTAERYPETGVVSPRLEWPDGTPQESCFRDLSPISEFIDAARTGPITAALKRFDVPLPVSDTLVRPQWTAFACVLVPHQLLQQIGLLDDHFFMYFEDVEFCRRTRKAGWEIIHNPQAKVIHLRDGSSRFHQKVSERK